MSEISHDGRVVIVTGAGGGLGRAHALLHAERGAKVVVNDLGGTRDGQGGDASMADQVVAEITDAGGTAVASYDGVDTFEGATNLVQTALDAFGRVDAVVNNAGILRDRSMKKMTPEDFDQVLKVHTYGSWNVVKAAWEHLLDSGSGRIVNTTSGAGLYGNFGQANYSSAKNALVGMARTLAAEGAKYGLKANVIAPIAWSRMTDDIFPEALQDRLGPETVAPLVAYLTSPQCDDTGRIYAVGGGQISRVATFESPGRNLGTTHTIEDVAAAWDEIGDMSEGVEVENAGGHAGKIMAAVTGS